MNKMINKSEAMEIFEKEAVLLGSEDVLPFYKAIDIFGELAAIFIDDNMKHNGYLVGGTDWNSIGACTKSRPSIDYFYKSGFLKLVSEYNYLISIEEHKHSKGGAIYNQYMDQRSRLLDKQKGGATHE